MRRNLNIKMARVASPEKVSILFKYSSYLELHLSVRKLLFKFCFVQFIFTCVVEMDTIEENMMLHDARPS